MLRPLAIACFACSAFVACDCGESDEPARARPGPTAREAEPPQASPRAALLAEVDARTSGNALRAGLASPAPELRRIAVLGLARLHLPERAPDLIAALRDPDAGVRRNASLGLGALEDRAPPDAVEALLGALAAEEDQETRAAMLTDLGRIAGEGAIPAFREALAGNDPGVRAAACTGLGSYGLRDLALEAGMLRRIAARMVDDPSRDARLACSYALTRLSPPVAEAEIGAVVEDLLRAAADEDPEVRAMAVRALGRYPGAPPDALVARTADRDWRVAVQAFRSLARLVPAPEAAYARALRARLDRALSAEITGPELHVLSTALGAAAPMARSSAIHGVATEALARIERSSGQPTRDRGLAHCAAAALVDLGRGWPTRLGECGLGQVTEDEQRARMAEVLGLLEGAAPERTALLARLVAEGGPRAKEAALAAAPSLDPAGVTDLVLGGLRSEDPGVITSAADAVTALAPKWRASPDEAPVLSVRAAGAPEPAAAPPPNGPPAAALRRALRAAWDHLSASDEVEGLQSWAHAVAAVGEGRLAEQLRAMLAHPAAPVRAAGAEALRSLGEEIPEVEPRPVPNPITASEIPLPDETVHAVLSTDRGDIEIALDPEAAPTTVARFRGLVEDDFYDGLTFHRVVPAFVVQGGDPRGDGYGGPGYTQRCEDNRLPYRRGTVGMALAGRDTGGSQFFITHSAQPHLEGRYTAFGRVVTGMDVVDSIQEGDRIRDVRITRDDG